MKRYTLLQLKEMGFSLSDLDRVVKAFGLKYGKKSGATTLTLNANAAWSYLHPDEDE